MEQRLLFLSVPLLVWGCANSASTIDPADNPDLSGPEIAYDLSLPEKPDIPPASKAVGETCWDDVDCESMLCRLTVPGADKVCVAPCKSQAECSKYPNMFCEASAAGSPDGFCILRSPMHCATCKEDSECGGLSERCMQAPGDIAAACHIDCAIAGAAACPTDYECASIKDGATDRKLCVPKIGVCLDAPGGFCNRAELKQPCSRENPAGICTGFRDCLSLNRYSECGARAPYYKMTCNDLDPERCRLKFAATALNTADNCGECGNACPGRGLSNNTPYCEKPADKLCNMSCRKVGNDEYYDVDGNPANGCERVDTVPPGHTADSAKSLGSKDCLDIIGGDESFAGSILSDRRQHLMDSVPGFNSTVGAAPDYFVINASGGFYCTNDYRVTITTQGGGAGACYKITIKTDKKQDSRVVSGSGSASMSSGSGSYSDGSQIYFWVEKICSTAQSPSEVVQYSVKYHL